jgi:hypothetical protein
LEEFGDYCTIIHTLNQRVRTERDPFARMLDSTTNIDTTYCAHPHRPHELKRVESGQGQWIVLFMACFRVDKVRAAVCVGWAVGQQSCSSYFDRDELVIEF